MGGASALSSTALSLRHSVHPPPAFRSTLRAEGRQFCQPFAILLRRTGYRGQVHHQLSPSARFGLKNRDECASLDPIIDRVVPDMKPPATAANLCRRCLFRAASGRCLNPTLRSGRCGDWIWYVRGGRRHRRRYTRPRDPRSTAQRRLRARFKAASRSYSRSLTQSQREACIARRG